MKLLNKTVVSSSKYILQPTKYEQCIVRSKAAYEGEGKTTVRILNQEADSGLMINAYSTVGFRLNNGVTVLGSMAIFSRTVLSWNISSSLEINDGALKLFKLLEPKVDLLVIGLEANDKNLSNNVLKYCRNLKINAEILPTEQACSTFNFLNAEGRAVAAALIPPQQIRLSDDDILQQQERYKNIYEDEISYDRK